MITGFPWLYHRTLAEVFETEELIRKVKGPAPNKSGINWARYYELRAREFLVNGRLIPMALVCCLLLAGSVAEARPPTSQPLIDAFRAQTRCPATGLLTGACAGYEIAYRVAPECGGFETKSNLQWLTAEGAALRTERELAQCGPAP